MTDTQGNLLAVVVHAANIHDTIGGGAVFDQALEKYPTIKGVSGDMGYRGTFVDHVVETGKKCDITERIKPKTWIITPFRWVVERTFAWASHSRRLSKDYEVNTNTEASWFTISFCHSVLRRF